MAFKPTDSDLEQMSLLGITPERLQEQIDHFRQGFPKCRLEAAATPDNGGIRVLTDKEIAHYERQYRTLGRGKRIFCVFYPMLYIFEAF